MSLRRRNTRRQRTVIETGAKVAGAGAKVAGAGAKVAGAAVWTGAWGKVAGWEVAGGRVAGVTVTGAGAGSGPAPGAGADLARDGGWRTNDDATRDLFSVMNSNPRRPDGSLVLVFRSARVNVQESSTTCGGITGAS